MHARKLILETMALISLALGVVGLVVIYPDIGKINADPVHISVADFAAHGLKKTILVDLADFDYGSRPVTELKPGTDRYSKVALVLFPKGHADEANSAAVILIVPKVSDARQFSRFCKEQSDDILGVIREGPPADFARQAVAKVYPQLNTAAVPVVIANDSYGLIFYGTFAAIVVGVWCIVLIRLLPLIEK